jgi:hypothetical protein
MPREIVRVSSSVEAGAGDELSESVSYISNPLHSTGWIAETSATYCCSFLAGSSAISTASAAVACALDWIYGREARANMHA